jgi:hypothetical protein
MMIFKSKFDKVKHENDNYNREEIIEFTEKIFGKTVQRKLLKKRAKLWYAADHLVDARILDKLSRSPFIEVRESVAANEHTSAKTLEVLLCDMYSEVRETAANNQNSPLSKVKELLDDEHEMVREAAKRRLGEKEK